ncbi:S9 family peptidase [Cognatiluteimonas telluris]|jgi:dipeptidyl aminopeptidase/acylaminoacyl peptidase|uniref:S9 family peptidase n=1 Tax=Cognatiluteimonas telluris TaxID=1104775 RepID=UPI00140B2DDE|nr:S9 family peptidase [Lysobacter telluris]
MLLGLVAVSSLAAAKEIPIGDFFREAAFEGVTLSPDGKHIAVVVPQSDRSVLAVLRIADMKLIGKWDYGVNRHFNGVAWANDHRLLFHVSIKLGSLDQRVQKGDMYASNIDGTGRIDIPNGAYYNIVSLTREDPDTILVERSIDNAFLFKLNVNNGRTVTVATAPIDYGDFVLDHNHNVRYAVGQMRDGSSVVYRRDGDSWTLVHEVAKGQAGVYSPVAMASDDKHVIMLRDENGGPAKVVSVDPESGAETALSSDPVVDPFDYLFSSDGKTLLAVQYQDGLPRWDFVDKTNPESKVYAGLINAFPNKSLAFNGISDDGRFVSFSTYSDRAPPESYLYDTQAGKATYLLSSREWIDPAAMSAMQPVNIKTRDGATIHGYLTIPKGSSGKNLPLIVHPHGGPHGVRDVWAYEPQVQLFANRGYAVLQINYRGSGGYGDAYQRAGYRKWGTLMQDDLTDSVRYLVANGIVDKDRVCIYGGSYGGYAALMSVEREPDLYKCTVGYAGVYDFEIQRTSSDTAESDFGKNYLDEVLPATLTERHQQSPAFNVEKIKVPVMLAHGGKDVRVPIQNLHELVDRMEKVGKKPEIVMIEPKEPHGFQLPEHNISLYETMLGFFDKYIGPGAKH